MFDEFLLISYIFLGNVLIFSIIYFFRNI